MKKATIVHGDERQGKETPGIFQVYSDLQTLVALYTLERAWLGNQRNVSRIPACGDKITLPSGEIMVCTGKYELEVVGATDHFPYNHFSINGVPFRTEVRGHVGCFVDNSEGCVLFGLHFGLADLNGDGLPDLTGSKEGLGLAVTTVGPIGTKIPLCII